MHTKIYTVPVKWWINLRNKLLAKHINRAFSDVDTFQVDTLALMYRDYRIPDLADAVDYLITKYNWNRYYVVKIKEDEYYPVMYETPKDIPAVIEDNFTDHEPIETKNLEITVVLHKY